MHLLAIHRCDQVKTPADRSARRMGSSPAPAPLPVQPRLAKSHCSANPTARGNIHVRRMRASSLF